MNKNGSSILIFVIISSIILIYYTNSWHSSSLFNELNYKKYEYQKKFRIVESLYTYGLLICIDKFDYFINQKDTAKTITIFNNKWPQNSNEYLGIIQIDLIDENKVKIKSTIINQKNKESLSINAILEAETIYEGTEDKQKKSFKKFNISSWQVV